MDTYFAPICVGMMLSSLLRTIIFETPESVIVFGITCVVFLLVSFIQKHRMEEIAEIKKELQTLKDAVTNFSLRF